MIRLAERDDTPAITKMLQQYSTEMDMTLAEGGFSLPTTARLVSYCIQQGLVWVDDDKGCLVALERLNMFSNIIKESQLVAIYVKPEFRGHTVGGRLLLTYDQECEKRGLRMSWIGARVDSSINEKSLAKLGYYLTEQLFLKER